MSYKLVGSIDPKTGSIDPKSHISKRKKTITYSFEAQIASCFFQYLKEIIRWGFESFLERLECILCLFCRSRFLYPKTLIFQGKKEKKKTQQQRKLLDAN